MGILGINTATGGNSLAFLADGKIIWEYSTAKSENTENLGGLIQNLLGQNKMTWADIEALAVAQGPGSFTGLRLGVVAAKTLAQSLKIPLIGVPTLEALAWQNRFLKGLLVAAIRAGLGYYHAALFGQRGGQSVRLTDDFVIDGKKLARRLTLIKEVFYLAGPDEELIGLLGRKKSKIIILEAASGQLRAAAVAELGKTKLSQGQKSDPLTLAPVYNLPPQIGPMKKGKRNKREKIHPFKNR